VLGHSNRPYWYGAVVRAVQLGARSGIWVVQMRFRGACAHSLGPGPGPAPALKAHLLSIWLFPCLEGSRRLRAPDTPIYPLLQFSPLASVQLQVSELCRTRSVRVQWLLALVLRG
jgi:hypothetical protein